MKDKFQRTSLNIEAEKYILGAGIEDGFEPWVNIVTNGWVKTDELIKITHENGQIVCPFIRNRRGVVFIREGDYIIYEEDGDRHCCGEDKFPLRFKKAED